ncbi:hypothetical protein JHK86_042986 [Glycine max]|nr:hypothetical protein JHK86_042986 [Glycine max]
MSSEGKNLLHEEENEYLDGKTFTSASTLSKIVCNSDGGEPDVEGSDAIGDHREEALTTPAGVQLCAGASLLL